MSNVKCFLTPEKLKSSLCFDFRSCRFRILSFQSTVVHGFSFYADGYCVLFHMEYQSITPLFYIFCSFRFL